MRSSIITATTVAILSISSASHAGLTGQDRILVNVSTQSQRVIKSYSYSGELLDSITIPLAMAHEPAGDLVVGHHGSIHLINGNSNPALSTLRADNTWNHAYHEGWNIGGNNSYMSLAMRSDGAVYAMDHGDADGLVLFDPRTNQSSHLSTVFGSDVAMGFDGLMYVKASGTDRRLTKYDPFTGQYRGRVELDTPHGPQWRQVAIDSDGTIFAAAWGGTIAKFASDGSFITQLGTSGFFHDWYDLDLAPDGTIIASDRQGNIFVTDKSLSSYTMFDASPGNANATTFVSFGYTIPAPSTALGLLFGTLIVRRKR